MLVLLSIPFIFANLALAEGAWVLWVQDNRFGNPTGGRWSTQTSAWRVITASSTETECRRKLQETIEREIPLKPAMRVQRNLLVF